MVGNGFDDDQTRSFIDLAAGTAVSHYRIVTRIDSGGMGDVFLADDQKLKRRVALKFLQPHMCDNRESLERFRQEAEAVALFSHPNIVTIHDVDESEGRPFIVMEYVHGCSLKGLIRTKPLSVAEVFDYSKQICDGLECAHKAGVIHRDLKLSNILVDDTGRVRLVDFGLVAVSGANPLTKPGHVVGTASYMSPEQVNGETIDHRSDIFSFGIVLYELLNGKHPFLKENLAATLHAIAYEDPAPPEETREREFGPLRAIVDKALQKDRDLRYQQIGDLKAELDELQSEISSPYHRRRFRWQTSWSAALILLVLVIILSGSDDARRFTLRLLGSTPVTQETHLAVLPFTDLGEGDLDQQFCEGLRETLTSRLTQLERFQGTLWVVPASEVTSRDVHSVRDAKKKFGVSMAVTGSVQQLGADFRLALNLVDTKSERQVRSEIIDLSSSQLPSLQDSIVTRMASMLQVHLEPSQQQLLTAGGTNVPEAYSEYLVGRGYLVRYEKLESVDSAISKFQHAISLDSRYANAYAGLGEAFWRKYRITNEPEWVTQATGNSQIALTLSPRSAPVHLTLGRIYRGVGKYEQAVMEYELVLSESPRDHDALNGLARTYESMGKNDEAEKYYKRVIEIRPNYWGAYFDIGLYYVFANRPDEALIPLEKAASLVPESAPDYNDIGALYQYLGFSDRAVQLWERSIEIEPTYPAYSNIGSVYYMAHDYENAAAAYKSALELNASDYRVWANLGMSYDIQQTKHQETIEAYRRAISEAEKRREVHPSDPILLASLAQYYAMVKDTIKARELTTEALKLDDKDTEVLVRVVFALHAMGDRTGAIHFVDRALEQGYPADELVSYPGLEELVTDPDVQKLIDQNSDTAAGSESRDL